MNSYNIGSLATQFNNQAPTGAYGQNLIQYQGTHRRDTSRRRQLDVNSKDSSKIYIPLNYSTELQQPMRIQSQTPDILSQNGLYQQIKNKQQQQQQQEYDQPQLKQKASIVRYQQQSSNKRTKEAISTSNRNSHRSTRAEQFFSQRQSQAGTSSKDNFKQVIRIYKEGLDPQGFQSTRIQAKETNLKQSLSRQNMSVPRPSQQPNKMVLHSQDYAYSNQQRTEFNKSEMLNSSVGNIRMPELQPQVYGDRLNDTAPVITSHTLQGTQQTLQNQPTLKPCNCPCQCQAVQNETTHMTSILSQTNRKPQFQNINNTMTLRMGNTTTVMLDDNAGEGCNIEDMHYVMVKVEKMKRKMLGKAEGFEDPMLDYEPLLKVQRQMQQEGQSEATQMKSSLEDHPNLNVFIFE